MPANNNHEALVSWLKTLLSPAITILGAVWITSTNIAVMDSQIEHLKDHLHRHEQRLERELVEIQNAIRDLDQQQDTHLERYHPP